MRIITEPDKRLHMPSAWVSDMNDGIRQLMSKMLEAMYKHNGIGLAAVQVGQMHRVIVVDTDQTVGKSPSRMNDKLQHGAKPLLMANPKVIKSSAEKSKYEEACLSYPSIHVEIERPAEVEVQYLDYDGNLQKITANGLLATCLQHEIDHTEGKVITDYASPLKRDILNKKVIKFTKVNPQYGA